MLDVGSLKFLNDCFLEYTFIIWSLLNFFLMKMCVSSNSMRLVLVRLFFFTVHENKEDSIIVFFYVDVIKIRGH